MTAPPSYDEKTFVEKYRVVGTLGLMTVGLMGFIFNSWNGVTDHGASIERHNSNHTRILERLEGIDGSLSEVKKEVNSFDRWIHRQEPRIDKAATFANEWPKSGRLAADVQQDADINALKEKQTRTEERLEKVEDRIWDKWTTQTTRAAGS